jgi:hypothetical protein
MMPVTSKIEALLTSKEGQIRIATRVEIPPGILLKTRPGNSVNSNKLRIFTRDDVRPFAADLQRQAGGNPSAGLGTQL